MGGYKLPITESINILNNNLSKVARVSEWAEIMGYNIQNFTYAFKKTYGLCPSKVLNYIRLSSIIKSLRSNKLSNLEIAQNHGLPEEKALNQFINYHLGCPPIKIKEGSYINLDKFFPRVRRKLRKSSVRRPNLR